MNVVKFPVPDPIICPLDELVARFRRGEISGLYIAITTALGEIEQLEIMPTIHLKKSQRA